MLDIDQALFLAGFSFIIIGVFFIFKKFKDYKYKFKYLASSFTISGVLFIIMIALYLLQINPAINEYYFIPSICFFVIDLIATIFYINCYSKETSQKAMVQ